MDINGDTFFYFCCSLSSINEPLRVICLGINYIIIEVRDMIFRELVWCFCCCCIVCFTYIIIEVRVRVMIFNVTFNNIQLYRGCRFL